MSEYLGKFICPECEKGRFWLDNWETYVSVVCQKCGHKMGEMPIEDLRGTPWWNSRTNRIDVLQGEEE